MSQWQVEINGRPVPGVKVAADSGIEALRAAIALVDVEPIIEIGGTDGH
jgi:hypothetical protein